MLLQGSKIFEDRIAHVDDPHVENLEQNGALIIGKSNLPELGAGANTYNTYGTKQKRGSSMPSGTQLPADAAQM